MKALIWIACFVALVIVRTSINMSGVVLGAIPSALLFGGTFFVAEILCKKWDERNKQPVDVAVEPNSVD